MSPDERRRDLHEWHRDVPDRKLAGVCAGVAEQLELPVTAVRAVFLVLALPVFSLFGVWLYLALWFLMPPARDAASAFDRVLEAGRTLFGETPRRREDDRDLDLPPR